MRLLFLLDRLDDRGGALAHMGDLMAAMSGRAELHVAAGVGRLSAALAGLAPMTRVPGLAAARGQSTGLEGLARLLEWADVVHAQNIMNPAALRQIVQSGKAVVTVQDHRVFCPGPGRTLPDGSACILPFERAPCAGCLGEGDYLHQMVAVTTERRDALDGAKVLVLSRYMQDELARVGLISQVISPWINPGPPRASAGDGFLLGGRLVGHKAPDLGWRAWRDSGVSAPLRVAGAGRLAGELEGAEALGWLGHAALLDWMSRSRALLFPSRWQEPFGILGLEALSQGLPAIAMNTGGVADWAEEGVILVPPGDVAAMADALRALHDDPARALALGEAGREAVSARFDREVILSEIWAVYQQIAGS